MGLFNNPYEHYEITWSTTSFKFHFHVHVDYIFSQSTKIMGFLFTTTYSSPMIDRLLILYLVLVGSEFEHDSTVWTSVISTDSKMLEIIQQKFIALCQYRFFIYDRGT